MANDVRGVASNQRLTSVTVRRLRVPLAVPYRLSLAELHAFDTILVCGLDAAGRTGFGEATFLSGYTDETIDESWALASSLAERLVGAGTDSALRSAAEHLADAPFTATAFTTMVEMLEDHPALRVEHPARVPIVGLVHASGGDELREDLEALLGAGFRTLKVKVGFDWKADLKRVEEIAALVRGRAALRLDANQGYAPDAARSFAAALDPGAVELFEQPCAAGDWDSALRVARVSRVPMMLDESIYGPADIRRAGELQAARYIKLKLMKMGGLSALAESLEMIRSLGMEPVLGNGVATDVSCWMEACVARGRVSTAGEMNGFLKPALSLLETPLRFESGEIVLEPSYRPRLDMANVESWTVGMATSGHILEFHTRSRRRTT